MAIFRLVSEHEGGTLHTESHKAPEGDEWAGS